MRKFDMQNMAKVLLFVCFFSVLNLATSEVVQFSKCEGIKVYGNLNELEIIPCPKQPCQLKRGTTVIMKAHFKLNENVINATSVVHAKVGGFKVPFPLPNPYACKDSGLKCPLKAGGTYIYATKLDVKSAYPPIETVVIWELQDKKKQDIFCFQISVRIV